MHELRPNDCGSSHKPYAWVSVFIYVLFFNSHGVSISNFKHQDIHFVIISDELVSFLNVLDCFLRTIIIYNFALKQKDASIKMLVLAIP
jgi:hypothetical protein